MRGSENTTADMRAAPRAGRTIPDRLQAVASLRFGAGSPETAGRLSGGWSHPEDGFTWATGDRSSFILDVPPTPGLLLLELDLNPFVPPGSVAGQRLAVSIDGAVIGQDRIRGEGVVAYELPAERRGPARRLTVTLDMPDARRPADCGLGQDRRELGFMLRSASLRPVSATPATPHRVLPPLALPPARHSATLAPALSAVAGLDMDELIAGFESLGHNCEFGMVQRHCGAEPMGLLRFAGITLSQLLAALQADFHGAGEADQLDVLLTDGPQREFIVRDTRFGFSLHTLRLMGETTEDAILADARRHLAFLRRKLLEDLSSGDRIFVFQRPGQTLVSQVRPLLARLRAHGHGALLLVCEDDSQAPGTVQELGYGLFRGSIDRTAPQDDVGNCNLAAWLSLCVNTRRLWGAQRAVFG